MSRPGARKDGITNTSSNEQDSSVQYCPVCKSSTYMNRNMTFLINPDCYHKMCTSCVDRIFSAGPAQCPIAGCKRTLRKHRFRKQLFEDIAMDREVDIRRRVREVFNRREDEFEDLQSWNNYLEDVEGLTFDLLYSKNPSDAERRLDKYRKENAASIKENVKVAREEDEDETARIAREKEEQVMRRRAYLREDEEEEAEKKQKGNLIIESLAKSDRSADYVLRQSERGDRNVARQRAGGGSSRTHAATASSAQADDEEHGFVIRGLKRKAAAPKPEKPFDPYDGLDTQYSHFTLQDHYPWDWVEKTCKEPRVATGGYDKVDYYRRALVDAFSGLTVFVGDEAGPTGAASSTSDTTLATTAAVTAVEAGGHGRHTDDVF